MHGLWHFLSGVFDALLLTVAIWVPVNIVLGLVSLGSVYSLRVVARVRAGLAKVPAGTVISCRGGRATMALYDARTDQEREMAAWTMFPPSLLSWGGGRRLSASRVRARATADLVWRGLLLVFLTLPLLIATAVLTVTDRWWWIWVPLLLVTHQIATYRTKRLVYLKPGFFYFLVSLLILHRIHAWYSTTTAVEWSGLPAVLSMIVMAAMGTRVAER